MAVALELARRPDLETFYVALGSAAASDFSFSYPLHWFTDLEATDRALTALLVNWTIALIPLYLTTLLIGTAARTCRRVRARRPV